jgi:hypothetical protein
MSERHGEPAQMNEPEPLGQMLATPPRRDWRIGVTTAASVVAHLLVIGVLLMPSLDALRPPVAPPPINVELVPPSQAPSILPPSSEPPPSSQPPSSEPASSEEPVSSEEPSMEPASSGEPASAASEEPASAASSAPASGASEATATPSTPSEAPVPMQRPVLIPVAPEEPSSEDASASTEASTLTSSAASDAPASSAAPDDASALTTTDPGADALALPSSASEEPSPVSAAASSEPPPPPKIDGALHVAKKFYLANMLQGPAMAKAREAIKKLPPQKRLVQTCNIEAIAQLGRASSHQPDAIVADAFAPTHPSGTSFTVTAGAFRSNKTWYGVSYECTLSKDMSKVQSFSFRIGDEVSLPSRAPAQVRQGG